MEQLTLDTASVNCAVHLRNGSGETYQLSETIGRGHAEHIMPMIDEALAALSMNYQDIKRLGVTIGPGSFTGVRVGLSVARGLALALDCPLVGVSLLDALAYQYQKDNPALVVLDAKRDEFFANFYDKKGSTENQAQLIKKGTDYLSAWQISKNGQQIDLIGSGAESFQEDDSGVRVLSNESVPSIEKIAEIVAKSKLPDKKPSPLYLRAPDAKVPSAKNFIARKDC